jgi:hypothetical protein
MPRTSYIILLFLTQVCTNVEGNCSPGSVGGVGASGSQQCVQCSAGTIDRLSGQGLYDLSDALLRGKYNGGGGESEQLHLVSGVQVMFDQIDCTACDAGRTSYIGASANSYIDPQFGSSVYQDCGLCDDKTHTETGYRIPASGLQSECYPGVDLDIFGDCATTPLTEENIRTGVTSRICTDHTSCDFASNYLSFSRDEQKFTCGLANICDTEIQQRPCSVGGKR